MRQGDCARCVGRPNKIVIPVRLMLARRREQCLRGRFAKTGKSPLRVAIPRRQEQGGIDSANRCPRDERRTAAGAG
jgi:hypothetical protein